MYKLLIVDDNNTHIQCVLDYVDWEKLHFSEIKTASNGLEAFEVFQAFQPDLVITDVVMPLSDGLELVQAIRKENSSTHIIFMSCHEDFNYVKSAIDNDITAYILKPIDPFLLEETALKVVSKIEAYKRATQTEQALSKFLPLVRESLLYRLLYSEHEVLPDELLQSVHMADSLPSLMVKYTILTEPENYVHIYELLNTAKAAFPDFSVNSIAEVPNKLIILLTDGETDPEEFLSRSIDAIRNHLAQIKQEYNLQVVAGVSSIFYSLRQAHTMLQQASTALESTFLLEAGEVYLFEDFEESESEAAEYNIYHLKQDLSTLLDKADRQAVDEFLEKYYPHSVILNKNTAKSLCFSTITSLQFLLSERNADIDDLFENSNIIWAKLNKFETIADTYQWLKNILIACCEFITDMEKGTKNSIVKNIQDYIDDNFKDIQSVNQIASQLFISAGYAKNVFKKYTGQTIFDYLVERRIKEAKKLLSDSSLKIYEISEMVGYTSKAHFTETFKRKTGMTPKEFQQR